MFKWFRQWFEKKTEEAQYNSLVNSMPSPPSGGLSDKTLRRDVWMQVIMFAGMRGFTEPVTQKSFIILLESPDSNQHWVEKWTATFSSGQQLAFKVEFSPSIRGGIDFRVSIIQ